MKSPKEILNKMVDEMPFKIPPHVFPYIEEAMKLYAEESVNEMLAEKDKEIPKWMPVTTKPEFDGNYLCLVMETEQCGATYTKQRVLCNSFNTWMTLANQSVLFWMPLPKHP